MVKMRSLSASMRAQAFDTGSGFLSSGLALAAARRRSRPVDSSSVSVVGPPTGAAFLRSICGPGLTGRPAARSSISLPKLSARQVLVGVGADLDERRVDAGAEALDLLPGKRAVRGEMMLLVMDAVAADILEVVRAAQPARRRPADLHVRDAADRLEMEHGVEGGDLEHADARPCRASRRRRGSPAR